jgi:hypothetical protein
VSGEQVTDQMLVSLWYENLNYVCMYIYIFIYILIQCVVLIFKKLWSSFVPKVVFVILLQKMYLPGLHWGGGVWFSLTPLVFLALH